MVRPGEMLNPTDEAIARVDEALNAVRQIPKQGQDGAGSTESSTS